MTSPPQPRKPLIVADLDLGVSGAMSIGTGGKRKAANQRQREAAEADAKHARWYAAFVEDLYGKQS